MPPQESDEEESESNDFEAVIEDIIQKFIDEQGTSTTNTLKIEVIDNPQAAEGDELPFLVTAELRVGEREDKQRNTSIKVINLIEKDRVPVEIEDTSDERDQSTEEDREIEPPKTKPTMTLKPNESK